jgi:hypothetical protein
MSTLSIAGNVDCTTGLVSAYGHRLSSLGRAGNVCTGDRHPTDGP